MVQQQICCLACGEGHAREVDLGVALRQCRACGLAWTADDLEPADELYGEGYFTGGGYGNYLEPQARRYESARRLRWLLRTGRPATLVEAGSAAGFFLAAARDAGIQVQGFEVSGPMARFAREKLGLPVRQGRFEDGELAAPVDVVCGFHVLEHVDSPDAFLTTAARMLAPGGRIAIEVPNIASAAARRLGAAWPSIQPRYHRWHFTPASLTHLLSRHGFEVVARDTVFSRFYWRAWPRWRQARDLLVADWVASGRPWVSHPDLGDLVRVVARRGERGATV